MIHGRKQLLSSHEQILKRVAEDSIEHEQAIAELRALGFTATEARNQLRETLAATRPRKVWTAEDFNFDADTVTFHRDDSEDRLVVLVNNSDYTRVMSGHVHRSEVPALIQWLRNNFEETGR